MTTPEHEAAWILIMLSRSLPASTRQSVVEAIERENRVFVQFPRKKRSLRMMIPISSSSSSSSTETVEYVLTEDPEAHLHDGPLTESPTIPTRDKGKGPMFPPMEEEEQPKKAKRKADGGLAEGASSSREPTPEWLVQLMRGKNGVNPKKIIEKGLTATDVTPNNNRLSMPLSEIFDLEFLTPAEEKIIEEDENRVRKIGVDAKLVCSDLTEFSVNLRKWDMGSSLLYNLVKGWNKVVQHCNLKAKHQICLWSFHSNDELYFALVPPPPTTTSDSGKSKSGEMSSALVIYDKSNDDLPPK